MNKGIILVLLLLCGLASAVFNSQLVTADSDTITVPDDYSTIATAIGNATNGDTILVKRGYYEEHSLVINKTISLIGAGAGATTINNIDKAPPWDPGASDFPPPAPDAIKISADGVRISGFTIMSPNRVITDTGEGTQIIYNRIPIGTTGIDSSGNNTKILRNILDGVSKGVTTSGWNQLIAENTFVSSTLDSGGLNSTILGNSVSNTGTGISLKGNFTTVSNNTLSASGLIITGVQNMVSSNTLSGGGDGIVLMAYPNVIGSFLLGGSYCANNIVCGNTVSGKQIGITIQRAENNTFYENLIARNEFGVSLSRNMTTGGNIQYLACYSFNNVFYHNRRPIIYGLHPQQSNPRMFPLPHLERLLP